MNGVAGLKLSGFGTSLAFNQSAVTCLSSEASSIEQLAEASKAGSREAFEQLVTHFERRIFHYLHQMTRNRHDAEDLTQITFLKAFRDIGSYRSRNAFSAWLFTIAKRTALNHFRAARKVEELNEEVEAPTELPSSTLEKKDEQESVWEIARRLKPEQYEALWLRYGENFSIEQVAHVMNSSQIRIRVLLHRARAALATKMERFKQQTIPAFK